MCKRARPSEGLGCAVLGGGVLQYLVAWGRFSIALHGTLYIYKVKGSLAGLGIPHQPYNTSLQRQVHNETWRYK